MKHPSRQNSKKIAVQLFLIWQLLFAPTISFAKSGSWISKSAGQSITFTVTESNAPKKDNAGQYLTIVYLENLSIKKIGQNTNATDVAWLLGQGYRVIELDYANHPKTISPAINEDIIKINEEIAAGSFCGLTNSSRYRSYILFEGYRIARDISFFKDNPTVYNHPSQYTIGDSLHMDIIYPANAKVKVPVILSFSYSNSTYTNKDQRVNLGYTFAGFNDSFLEGAPAYGIAWAIADHPKYASWGNGKPTGGANDTYKSYQTNPDAAQKVKSAVRTLRVLGAEMGLSGKIGIYGFSRGSDAGAMAVGDRVVPAFENAGMYIGSDDNVQAAALGSGVFDFTQIYNTLGDGDTNLETRCPWAWGPLADNLALWESMGAAHLAETSASAPVLFFYNTSDSHYYQDQIAHFKARLDSIGVPTATLIDYGTGHAVPQNNASLNTTYQFFKKYLTPPLVADSTTTIPKDTTTTETLPVVLQTNEFTQDSSLLLFPNTATNELQVSFNLSKADTVRIELSSLSGTSIYKSKKTYKLSGTKTETINLEALNLTTGIYTVKVSSGEMQEVKKFMKK
jgi:dienelactone hydrolase